MDSDRVVVRRVAGRYPGRAIFRPENIEAQVEQEARIIRIRIDDAEHSEAWTEIVLEIQE